MGDRPVDHGLYTDFAKDRHTFDAAVEKGHQPFNIARKQFTIKIPVHAVQGPGLGSPGFIGADQ